MEKGRIVIIDMPVAGLLEGDQFVADGRVLWTALADAVESEDGSVVCSVRFADGGKGSRYWLDGDAELPVRRIV